MNKAIKVYTQLYVGIKNIPSKLAFLTPDGDDSAAVKRKSTVNHWLGEDGKTTTIQNKPMCGFEVVKEVRRWSTQNVVWTIKDPNGYTLEISSANLAYLIEMCVISKGVIQAELIWARIGSQNWLIPTNSQEYKNALIINGKPQKSIKKSELKIGDKCLLKTGVVVVFHGSYYLYPKFYSKFIPPTTKDFIFRSEDGSWLPLKSPKILKIIEHDCISEEDAYEDVLTDIILIKHSAYASVEKLNLTVEDFVFKKTKKNKKFIKHNGKLYLNKNVHFGWGFNKFISFELVKGKYDFYFETNLMDFVYDNSDVKTFYSLYLNVDGDYYEL